MPQTATVATVPLSRLTDWIRDQERILAPGSESGLFWGEPYCQRSRHDTATLDREGELVIPATEAAWWIGAYCAALAVQAGGCDRYPVDPGLLALLPVEPIGGDWDTLAEVLGVSREDIDAGEWPSESAALREGYAWHMEQVRDAADDAAAIGELEATADAGGGGSHTPGPWRSYGGWTIRQADRGCIIAAAVTDYCADTAMGEDYAEACRTSEIGEAEATANARLLAAAPVMLTALRTAEHTLAAREDEENSEHGNYNAMPSPELQQIREAIATAVQS